jgi:hypothetical protein
LHLNHPVASRLFLFVMSHASMKHIVYDTNCWKSFVHARLVFDEAAISNGRHGLAALDIHLRFSSRLLIARLRWESGKMIVETLLDSRAQPAPGTSGLLLSRDTGDCPSRPVVKAHGFSV